MTERLITHLRHVDLAVPDYDKATRVLHQHLGPDGRGAEDAGWRSWPPRARPSSTSCGCARTPTSAWT